jgi:hypothetical protein
MAGKKRASPGAEVEKDPLAAAELTDEDSQRLMAIQKETARLEIAVGPCPPQTSARRAALTVAQSATRRRGCRPCTRSGGRS